MTLAASAGVINTNSKWGKWARWICNASLTLNRAGSAGSCLTGTDQPGDLLGDPTPISAAKYWRDCLG